MPSIRSPRKGSLQFWPRKKAARIFPKISSVKTGSEKGLAEFAGYKVGMTHVIVEDNRKTSRSKSENVFVPVTVLECPKFKILGVRAYSKDENKLSLIAEEIFYTDKSTKRTTNLKKSKKIELSEDVVELRAIIQTSPTFKKTPELFEVRTAGPVKETYEYLKSNKELSLEDVFAEGDYVDVHAVTKGKGFQGPVKRFGISLRSHKSEKSVRTPGSLGPWQSGHHVATLVAKAGQTGFQTRTEHSKFIMSISDDVSKILPKGDFLQYGKPTSEYVLLKGSIPGSRKRLIRLTPALRRTKEEAPQILSVHQGAKQ